MTGTDRPRFDLRDEPWLLARTLGGGVEQLSLREIFARAHVLGVLVGEVPTQNVALTRLLLAVMHRALLPFDQPMAQWEALWRRPAMPVDAINGHLDKFGDRLDLLHPETPFLQVADLRSAKADMAGVKPLLADVPNNDPFFTTRGGDAVRRLSFAEAARWLVHCQAYDPSGIKSGAVGDDRVKGGKGYPIGTGWAGGLGAVLVEGNTLRETLLLNLVPVDDRLEPLGEVDDQPVWERPPLSAAVEDRFGAPTGPADLYTWPSRRIRLRHDGAAVTGVLVANGDALKPQNQFIETMTSWRQSPAQEKKLGGTQFMPRTHDPERSLWRGLEGLLVDVEDVPGRARRRPLVLRWLDRLMAQDALPLDLVLRTRAIGMVYGSNNSVVAEIVDDALSVRAVLLGERGQALRNAAVDAVRGSDAAARAIGQLAENLALAAGGEPEGPDDRAREQAYFALDRPYRAWLAGLEAATAPREALTAWHQRARSLFEGLARDAVEAAGTPAWTGRVIRTGKGERLLTAPVAELWFRSALRKALPLAFPEPDVAENRTSTTAEESA